LPDIETGVSGETNAVRAGSPRFREFLNPFWDNTFKKVIDFPGHILHVDLR